MAHDPTRLVVVIMTGLDAYQAPLLDGICQVLLENDYSVFAHVNHAALGDLSEQLKCLLTHWSPCGVIATSCMTADLDHELHRLVSEQGMSAVYIGQDLPGQTCVRADNVQGMTALMAHLLDEYGARSPGLARGATHLHDHVDREMVFRTEMARRGLVVDEELIIGGGLSQDVHFHKVRSLLRRRRDLDALVTMGDWAAMAAMGALAEAGLDVPGDVAVTGFDNYPTAALNWPGITSVDQNLTEQGTAAAKALLDRLAGAPSGEHQYVSCSLVVRGSTLRPGAPASDDPFTVRDVSQLAQSYLADQSALNRISRSLIECRNLDDVCAALTTELNPLGVRRCFLVLYQAPDTVRDVPGTHLPARLLVDYRDQCSHPVPDKTFTSCLLPEHLQRELTCGFLALQPLTVGQDVLGYMLLELSVGTTPIAETLRLDIAKALKAALDTLELHQQVEQLENRTRELRTAVRELNVEMEERRRVAVELKLSSTVFENSPDGIAITDSRACIISMNPAFTTITGYSAQELMGRPISVLRPRRHGTSTYRELRDALLDRGFWEGEVWSRRRTGEEFLAQVGVSTVGRVGELSDQYVVIFNDVTELRRKDEYIQRLAFHDELTGLPNRALFADRLNQRIVLAQRQGESLGVMFLDLDRFKVINGSYGHDVGNRLLAATAVRLKDFLRESDTIARVGGDEFVAVLTRISGPEDYAGVAQRAIAQLSQPMTVDGHLLRVGASAGISCFPDDGRDGAELMRHAEAAMHSAKSSGGGTYRFFRSEMTAQAQLQLQVEMELRDALVTGGLELFYQPKVSISDGALRGAEALVRWRHPTRGLLGPLEFIPLAEERGIICDLGNWVLGEACRQSREWQRSYGSTVTIGVNISAVQVQQTDLVKEVIKACATHEISPSGIEVELTESSIMDNLARVSPTFSNLRGIGVTVAVDDFGTGFIMNIEGKTQDREILKTIITLGRALSLDIVAEGIETQGQADLLMSYECHTAQGYLFARPLPAKEFESAFLSQPSSVGAV
jgi:diguanylate cyclase (GGDEF)-like protein/PAS domain S-box-containing protein